LVFNDGKTSPVTFGYLHYGDSSLIQKIKIWAYIELI